MGFWDIITAGLGLEEVKSKNKSPPRVEKPDYVSVLGEKISIKKPVTFYDITQLVAGLRKNVPLIVNFMNLEPRDAERSLDFVCGAVCATGGSLERIGEGIYFYAPASIKVEIDKKYKRT